MIKNIIGREKTKIIGRNQKGGFTLVETLVTMSIIIILLAIGLAGILRYRDYLRITELDNMARSIYMAAQNRAVLLDNDRRFQTLVKGVPQADGTFLDGGCTQITLTGSGKERWYIDSETAAAAALDDLLPAGTIDPALQNGRFYIVYEAESASVTDVFYVEKQDYDLAAEFASGIAGALEQLGADDKRDARMNNKKDNKSVMVGWFGSNAAAPRDKKLKLPDPGVEILIENGNELTLQVTYTMPSNLPAGVKTEDVTRVPSVVLEYKADDGDTKSIDLLASGRLKKNYDITTGTVTEAQYTWVLDSLDLDSNNKSQRFKDLGSDFEPEVELTELGRDFKVTAGLTLKATGCSDSSYSVFDDEHNSLFAQNTHNGSVAYIENLRHLQNLDNGSGVGSGITTAEQTEDIDAGTLRNNKDNDNVIKTDYKFTPIENGALLCYRDHRTDDAPDGKVDTPYSIANLKVTADSAAERESAGLFAEASGTDTDAEEFFRFQNVRLVNPEVTGGGKAAGGLVGSAENVRFENCQASGVYVIGNTAGGLAGRTEAAEFVDCIVAEVAEGSLKNDVYGEVHAGGMAGNATGECLFQSCQVSGTQVTGTDKESAAGGMAGNMTGGSFIGCQVVSTAVKGTKAGSTAGGMAGKTNGVTFGPYTNTDGAVKKCSVENVAVEAVYIAGGMAGYSTGDSFNSCETIDAEVGSKDTTAIVGGMSGYSEGETVRFSSCHVVSTKVTSGSSVAGGMAGQNWGSTTVSFEDCGVEDIEVVTSTGHAAGGLMGYKGGGGSVMFTRCLAGADGANLSTITGVNAGGMLGCTENPEGGATTASFTECTVGKADAAAKNVIVIAISGCAGGLAGNMTDGSFTGCQVVGTRVEGAAGGSIAGGMAGSANQAAFVPAVVEGDAVEKKCRVEKVTVKAKKCSGGMAGVITAGGSFQYCEVVSAEVSDTGEGGVTDSAAGGMAGDAGSAGFDHCVVRGITVTANGLVGGLAGAAGSSYSNCQVPNAVIEGKGERSYAGGLAGDTGANQFTNCTVGESNSSIIQVTAGLYAGGLTGYSWGSAAFSGCKVFDTTVETTASYKPSENMTPYAGGLTGASGGETVNFENCYVSGGSVKGSYCAGGMAGHNFGSAVTFENCGIKHSTVTAEGMSAGGLLAFKSSALGTETEKNVKFIDCTVGKFPKKDGEPEDETKVEDAVTITAQSRAGGLLGYVDNNCHAIFSGCQVVNATVTAGDAWDASAGGLAGKTGKDTQFSDCMAGGEKERENISVTALLYAGGLSGASVNSSFSNCQAVNATVTATAWNGRAGGLVGRLVNYLNTVKNDDPTEISSCKVYWTHSLPEKTTDLQTVDYKIRANGSEGMAGGLVGEIATSKATIQNSFAAAFVYGGGYVGGLIGYLSEQVTEDQWGNSSKVVGTPPVSVEKSYADCYIMLEGGTGWYAAGGLVGSNGEAELTLKDVYAAGFITINNAADKGNFSGDYAAGLCGGNVNLKVENAYAAMYYDQGNRIPYIFPLAKEATPHNSFYLYNDNYVVTNAGGWYETKEIGTPYGEMANLSFGAVFVTPPNESHPYNIDGRERSTYPFPGLTNLPHYGDWVTQEMMPAINAIDEEPEAVSDKDALEGAENPDESPEEEPPPSAEGSPEEESPPSAEEGPKEESPPKDGEEPEEETPLVAEEGPKEEAPPSAEEGPKGEASPVDVEAPGKEEDPETDRAPEKKDGQETGGEGSEAELSSQDEAGAADGGGDTS